MTYKANSLLVQVIHHEVKELGTHILVCEVTYNSAHTDKMNFRKFFKFQVLNLNTRIHLAKV